VYLTFLDFSACADLAEGDIVDKIIDATVPEDLGEIIEKIKLPNCILDYLYPALAN